MVGTLAVVVLAALQGWPRITPLDTLFRVLDATHPHVRAFVNSRNGAPVYLFICRQADDSAAGDVNYSGDLDCRLMPAAHGEVEENLLVESGGLAAWYSRGRMLAGELRGACAVYPEYGLLRHFRLRGMQITLEFRDVVFAPSGELRSYELRLRVASDPTARRAIAALSGYLDPGRQVPGRSCDVIKRGNEWR